MGTGLESTKAKMLVVFPALCASPFPSHFLVRNKGLLESLGILGGAMSPSLSPVYASSLVIALLHSPIPPHDMLHCRPAVVAAI